jgi:hypothetical protein
LGLALHARDQALWHGLNMSRREDEVAKLVVGRQTGFHILHGKVIVQGKAFLHTPERQQPTSLEILWQGTSLFLTILMLLRNLELRLRS